MSGVFDKRVGYTCNCCGQFVKVYCRTFNSNMAVALFYLYKRRSDDFIHVENEMSKSGYKRCGDFSYLRHYSLIEPLLEKRDDSSNRNGMYRITGRGILFIEQNLFVQKNFLTFNNKLEGFEGKEIGIIQALGIKYDYKKMMEA